MELGNSKLEVSSTFFKIDGKLKFVPTPNYFLKIFFFLAHSIKNRRRAGRHRAGPRKYWGRNLVGKKNSANKLDISNFLLARTGPREPSRNFFRAKASKLIIKLHPSLFSFVSSPPPLRVKTNTLELRTETCTTPKNSRFLLSSKYRKQVELFAADRRSNCTENLK